MSKKSIIYLVIFLSILSALIPLLILSSTSHPYITISQEFSTINYGGSHSIVGELQNCSDKPIVIDELTIFVSGNANNTPYESKFNLYNITLDKNYIVEINNLVVSDFSGNEYYSTTMSVSSVECIIDEKTYSLHNSQHPFCIPIILILIIATLVLIFLVVSLKKNRRQKKDIYDFTLEKLNIIKSNNLIINETFNKALSLINLLHKLILHKQITHHDYTTKMCFLCYLSDCIMNGLITNDEFFETLNTIKVNKLIIYD